jgi:hypothetical protein
VPVIIIIIIIERLLPLGIQQDMGSEQLHVLKQVIAAGG